MLFSARVPSRIACIAGARERLSSPCTIQTRSATSLDEGGEAETHLALQQNRANMSRQRGSTKKDCPFDDLDRCRSRRRRRCFLFELVRELKSGVVCLSTASKSGVSFHRGKKRKRKKGRTPVRGSPASPDTQHKATNTQPAPPA